MSEARKLILPGLGGQITVTFPREMTALDLQILQEALKIMERWIIVPQKAGVAPEEATPRPATGSGME